MYPDMVLESGPPRLDGIKISTGDELTSRWSKGRQNDALSLKPRGRAEAEDSTAEKPGVRWTKPHRLATWNVRGMGMGKLDVIKQEMDRLGIEILGVSELKWTGMGHFDSGQYRVYFSGHESIWHRGVAFVVNRSVAMSVLGYETVNDRIITIRIQGRALNLTIIQVYAPTTEASESDIEDFYSSLQETFDAAPSKDIKLLIGDFNAKVGCSIEPSITGSLGLGERNDAGDRLVEFCAENELTITNTLFKQPNRRLYTWTSPDGNSRNQIDYIICQRRWKSSVLSVKTRPGADCGTDHELLEARLSVRFKKLKRQIKTIKLDLDDIPADYAVAVSNRFDALQLDNLTVETGGKSFDHVSWKRPRNISLYWNGSKRNHGCQRRLSLSPGREQQHKQPNRRLYTWTSPDGNSRNQIDYIICQRRWKSSVLSVKTRPGADCGTDHELLEARLSVRFKKLKRQIKTIKLDLDDIPADYAVAVSNRFDALQLDNLTVDDRWEKLRSCVMEEAQKHIPVLERKQKKPWLSEKALSIARKRREAKSQHRKHFMKQFHREFKLQARKDKEEYLTEKCSEMESNYKHGRTRDCFTVIKEITGKFRPKYSGILDENKQLVSSGEEVKQRWLNYTEALYKKNSSITCSPMTTESSDFLHEMEPEILESEIRSAIAQLPNRKSPGIDGIPIELVKALGDRGTRMIHEMCNEIWRTREWPQQWKQSVYIPIPKKGDPRECGNNRTIALITHASKVLLKVMQRRIEPYMQRELAAEQAGFRKGRGTRDQIANLRWILEKGR